MSNAFHAIIWIIYTVEMFSLQCQQRNAFDTKKDFKVMRLKELFSFIFKIWGPKYIQVLDNDKFQFHFKV